VTSARVGETVLPENFFVYGFLPLLKGTEVISIEVRIFPIRLLEAPVPE
jgi:hypothetical protein